MSRIFSGSLGHWESIFLNKDFIIDFQNFKANSAITVKWTLTNGEFSFLLFFFCYGFKFFLTTRKLKHCPHFVDDEYFDGKRRFGICAIRTLRSFYDASNTDDCYFFKQGRECGYIGSSGPQCMYGKTITQK